MNERIQVLTSANSASFGNRFVSLHKDSFFPSAAYLSEIASRYSRTGGLSFGKDRTISFNNLDWKSPKEPSSKPSNAVATLFSAGSKMESSWGEHCKNIWTS